MMMKIFYLLLILFISSCNRKLDNTIYKARIGSSCAKTSTGGFMIYDSCRLYFSKDSVKIHYYQADDNNPRVITISKWKNYSYSFNENILNINDFQYKNLIYTDDTLIYKNRNEYFLETLKFIKE